MPLESVAGTRSHHRKSFNHLFRASLGGSNDPRFPSAPWICCLRLESMSGWPGSDELASSGASTSAPDRLHREPRMTASQSPQAGNQLLLVRSSTSFICAPNLDEVAGKTWQSNGHVMSTNELSNVKLPDPVFCGAIDPRLALEYTSMRDPASHCGLRAWLRVNDPVGQVFVIDLGRRCFGESLLCPD